MVARRVVIAGGTGFLGRPLAAALAARGDEVVVLSRDPGRVRDLPRGARAVRWDARSAAGWQDAADGAAALVNLAGDNLGSGRWTDAKKRRIVESRLQAGRAMTAAIAAAGGAGRPPRALIQASAVGYYGDRGDDILSERAGPGRGFLAATCVEWEASTSAVESLGVRRAVARTGVVLAGDGGALPRLALPFRFFAGGRLGDGRQWMPWIDLDDEVRALLFLIDDDRAAGAFNLCAPNPVTNAAMTEALARTLRRPGLLAVPAFALQLALGEMSAVVLEGQRCIPERLLALGFSFARPELDGALAHALGRAPA